jgi:hypothetical protein
VAEAAGGVGERRSHRVQAIEPEGAAGGVRYLRARGVLPLAIGAVVETRTLAVLAVLIGAGLEGLSPLRAGTAVVRLAIRARALRTGVLRGAALAVTRVAGALLAIVGLTMGTRGSAAGAAARGGAPGAWWATAATVAVGMGRFHWRRV